MSPASEKNSPRTAGTSRRAGAGTRSSRWNATAVSAVTWASRSASQSSIGFSSAAAARYFAAALDYLEDGEEQNRQLLQQLRSRATSVTLGDGEQRSIQLDVISR